MYAFVLLKNVKTLIFKSTKYINSAKSLNFKFLQSVDIYSVSPVTNLIIDCTANWYNIYIYDSKITNVSFLKEVKSINNFNYIPTLTNLTLCDGLLRMGVKALEGTNISSIILPNSLKEIGAYAFKDTKLDSIFLPENLTSIEISAFENTPITSIELPNTLSYIGSSAFSNTKISSINIPYLISSIPDKLFYNCVNLQSISLPEGIVSIGELAFAETAIRNITLPSSVTSIGEESFKGTNISTFAYPANITKIQKGTFKNCTNLTTFVFNDNILSIASEAFYNCGLENVVLPKYLMFLGDNVFNHCLNLNSVTFGNNISSIGDYVFSDCINLTKQNLINTLPNYIYKIIDSDGYYNSEQIGDNNFKLNLLNYHSTVFKNYIINVYEIYNDEDLTSVLEKIYCERFSITNSTKYSVDENGFLYNIDKTILIKVPTKTTLTSYVMPTSVVKIETNAFKDIENLTSLTITNNEILNSTDEIVVSNIETLILASSITETDLPSNNILKNIASIKTLDLESTSLITISDGAFNNLINLENILLPNTINYLGNYLFNDTKIKTFVVPDRVTELYNIFGGSKYIEKIVLNSNTTEIKDKAFYGCINLKEINLLNVKVIGYYAFSGCENLTNIDISNITNLGIYAFKNCGLTTVTIPSNLLEIKEGAFSGNINLTSLVINEGVEIIDSFAFFNCKLLTSVNIPSSLLNIKEYSFSNCTKLETITINNSNIVIADYAFNECISLTQINFDETKYYPSISLNAFVGCDDSVISKLLNRVQLSERVAFTDYVDFWSYFVYTNNSYLEELLVDMNIWTFVTKDSSIIGGNIRHSIDYILTNENLQHYQNSLNFNIYKKMKENFPNLKSIKFVKQQEEYNTDNITASVKITTDNDVIYIEYNYEDSENSSSNTYLKTILFYPFYKTETTYTLPSDVNKILPDCGLLYNDNLQEINVDENSKYFISIENIIYTKNTSIVNYLEELGLPEYAKIYINDNPDIKYIGLYFNKVYVYIPYFIKNVYIDNKQENNEYLIFIDSYIETITIDNAKSVSINALNMRSEYKIENNNSELFIENELNLKYIKTLKRTLIDLNDTYLFAVIFVGQFNPIGEYTENKTDFYVYNSEQVGELDYTNYSDYFINGIFILGENQYAYPDYYKHYVNDFKYYKD